MSQSHITEYQSKHWVLVPAAGVGKRMQATLPKQYLPLLEKTIIEQTLSIFLDNELFNGVYLGLSQGDPYWPELAVSTHPKLQTFEGGDERVDTVYRGLLSMGEEVRDNDWIWVHDAARPCLNQADIEALYHALAEQANDKQASGALLGVKVNDTVKRVDDMGRSEQTVDREFLWRAMTPQVFRLVDLKRAIALCQEHKVFVTDDASAMEFAGKRPVIIPGSDRNIKITRPDDLTLAEIFMKEANTMTMDLYPRVGSGYDVHAFEEGDFITIGGVKIPHTHGLKAHSDGDVLLHALSDALLGAFALGDIGKHFPDTDDAWKGADSRKLLRAVFALIKERSYRVGNVDVTVIAQSPKMAPHIEAIQANIAQDLEISAEQVGVKATTTEKLGFTGRKEGIAAQAAVMLIPNKAGSA